MTHPSREFLVECRMNAANLPACKVAHVVEEFGEGRLGAHAMCVPVSSCGAFGVLALLPASMTYSRKQ